MSARCSASSLAATRGLTYSSPAAAARTASTSSASASSLATKPQAPAASARWAKIGSSSIVRTTIRVLGTRSLSARTVSMLEPSVMPQVEHEHVGLVAVEVAHGGGVVGGLRDHLHVLLGSSSRRSVRRISTWSSASTTRIGSGSTPSRHGGRRLGVRRPAAAPGRHAGGRPWVQASPAACSAQRGYYAERVRITDPTGSLPDRPRRAYAWRRCRRPRHPRAPPPRGTAGRAASAAIATSGLCKRYGSTRALEDLDLRVPRGQVFGYLGPNGAGKTTTIRLLLGLHRPSAGRAELFGIDAWREPVAAHARVAYVSGEPALWPSLTGAETLEFLARVRGGSDVAYRELLVERFQLQADRRVRALSKGNRQKVQLIAAFATRAELLILDEPTAGLDPLMEVAFRETVIEAKERGQTVFLSSHILSEVEALCDRVGILRAGRLVDEGTLAELRHLSARTLEVSFRGPRAEPRRRAGGERRASARAGALRLEVSGELAPLISVLAQHPVESLTSREPSLEEIFLHHYREQGEGALPRPRDMSAAASRRARAAGVLATRATRTAGFALLFALVAYAQPAAYRSDYPTPPGPPRLRPRVRRQREPAPVLRQAAGPAERRRLQRLAGRGHPRDLLRRLGDARRGAGAARRGGQRQDGAPRRRAPLPAADVRRRAYAAAWRGVLVLWAALLAGLLAGGLPAGGRPTSRWRPWRRRSVFLGLGALACQLAPSRRLALELAGAVLLVALVVRVVADTSSSLGWLRWLTPLGWSEELRAFAGPRPAVLALPAALSLASLAGAGRAVAGAGRRHAAC